MPDPLTGAILVGGRSSRMGSDKALLRVDEGPPLIVQTAAALAACCDEILLVGGDPARFAGLDLPARWVPDGREGVGPLGGVLGALQAARNPACLVVACDMPYISRELVAAMAAQPRMNLVLAYSGPDDLEPMLAIYRRDCIEPLQVAISSGELSARRFLARVDAQPIPIEVLEAVDAERRAATNLNSPGDLVEFRARLDR